MDPVLADFIAGTLGGCAGVIVGYVRNLSSNNVIQPGELEIVDRHDWNFSKFNCAKNLIISETS